MAETTRLNNARHAARCPTRQLSWAKEPVYEMAPNGKSALASRKNQVPKFQDQLRRPTPTDLTAQTPQKDISAERHCNRAANALTRPGGTASANRTSGTVEFGNRKIVPQRSTAARSGAKYASKLRTALPAKSDRERRDQRATNSHGGPSGPLLPGAAPKMLQSWRTALPAKSDRERRDQPGGGTDEAPADQAEKMLHC